LAIRKILVAVDGSDPSLDASACAIDLAKSTNAELIVLFIVSPLPYSEFEYAYTGREKEIETTEKEKAHQVIDKVKQNATENNVSVETTVLVQYTSVVKEIVEYAEKMNVDMIVIGSKGKSGFKRMLLGGVASGIVTYSHCPVLVVK
jgi:nucleotide-binding universal stress UspA family protein